MNKGIQLAFITAFVSGVSIFINKFAVGAITPPLVFTATKNVGVGLVIIALLIFSRKISQLKSLSKQQIKQLVLIGIIGGSIPFYLFFTGLSQIPAINAALIHKTLVLWVALFGLRFLKENISYLQLGAIFLLFASNALVGGFSGLSFSTGELMILAATLFWAVENIIAKKALKTLDPDLLTGARMGFGSLILLAFSFIFYPQSVAQVFSLTGTQYFWLGATALTLLAYVMTWYRALKYAPATLVTTVLVASTLVTNVLSAIFITHNFSWELWLQSGLMVLGIAVFVSEMRKTNLPLLANN
ncbi:DMT family transporter [Candidatus Beckwithbacteria bacterium]|nr:DMT family transporter [Candidatus Beckwithbacteria bacterium]